MNLRPNPRCIALALLLVAALPAAHAADFPPLKREAIFDETLPAGLPTPRIVKSARIRFAPGQPTGPHRHPVFVFGVVTEGSFVFQVLGQASKTLRTGDAFYEPAGTEIVHFDNASQQAPAAITAFYLLDAADRPLIEMIGADHK